MRRKRSTDFSGMQGGRDFSEYLRRARRLLETCFSNRKVVIPTLLALGLLLYFWPNWFRSNEPASDASIWCLSDRLRGYAEDIRWHDSAVVHWPSKREGDSEFLPYIASGQFGLGPTEKKPKLRLLHRNNNRAVVSVLLEFQPLLSFSANDLVSSSDAFVTEYRKGSVTKLQSVSTASHCVVISTVSYFHRVYPSVLVQDVSISNPLDTSVEISASAVTFKWKDLTKDKIHGIDVTIGTTSVVDPDDSRRIIVLSAVVPHVAGTLVVKPRSTENFHFVTVIDTSEPTQSDLYGTNRGILEKKIKATYLEISSQTSAALYALHTSTWNKLWQSGFSISYSWAPNVLNGNQINATMYYVLSNSPAPLHEKQFSTQRELSSYAKALANPDRCYGSHNTLLYPSKLWPQISSVDGVIDLTNSWLLTLDRTGGCRQLLDAGADGILQAMILSFGGLKFTHHHLEFDTEPKDLHRDYHFRNIAYNASSLSIWVEVGQNNKAVLYASINRSLLISALSPQPSRQQFFACDAGCLDLPVELGSERAQFPVKLTEPLTPVLYITADKDHITELKHTIHVKEVVEAPAHDHQLIAIHKHGHSLGGLPTFFWVALILLIVTFHLFLCKLIYNEYFRDDGGVARVSSSRSKYSL